MRAKQNTTYWLFICWETYDKNFCLSFVPPLIGLHNFLSIFIKRFLQSFEECPLSADSVEKLFSPLWISRISGVSVNCACTPAVRPNRQAVSIFNQREHVALTSFCNIRIPTYSYCRRLAIDLHILPSNKITRCILAPIWADSVTHNKTHEGTYIGDTIVIRSDRNEATSPR